MIVLKYKANIRVATTEDLENLFDLDFIENEEYYRKDTLSLGYANEADRVIVENTDRDGIPDIDAIVKIAFSSCFYLDYDYAITEAYNEGKEKIEIISVAHTEQ